MHDRWTAVEVQKTGDYYVTDEEEYVVIATYMLSSMTYISQVAPE